MDLSLRLLITSKNLTPAGCLGLQVVNSAVMAAQGQVDSYCVQATGSGPVKVGPLVDNLQDLNLNPC